MRCSTHFCPQGSVWSHQRLTPSLQWGEKTPPQRMNCRTTRNYSTAYRSRSWWKWLPRWEFEHLCRGRAVDLIKATDMRVKWRFIDHLLSHLPPLALGDQSSGSVAEQGPWRWRISIYSWRTQQGKCSGTWDWGLEGVPSFGAVHAACSCFESQGGSQSS